MTAAGLERFPALRESMKFLTRNNIFQKKKRQHCLGKRRFQLFLAGQGRPAQGSQTSKSVDFLRNLKVLNEQVLFYLRTFIVFKHIALLSASEEELAPIYLGSERGGTKGWLVPLLSST